jgi:hypothetical protein
MELGGKSGEYKQLDQGTATETSKLVLEAEDSETVTEPEPTTMGMLSSRDDDTSSDLKSVIDYDFSRIEVRKPCKSSRTCKSNRGESCCKQVGNPPQYIEITEGYKDKEGKFVPTGEEGVCVNPMQAYGDLEFGHKLRRGDYVVAIDPETISGCLGKAGRIGQITNIKKPSIRQSEPRSGELIYSVRCLNMCFLRNRDHSYWWNDIREATTEEVADATETDGCLFGGGSIKTYKRRKRNRKTKKKYRKTKRRKKTFKKSKRRKLKEEIDKFNFNNNLFL